MSIICPTVLAATTEEYQEQLDAIVPFAQRVQIDLGDGEFTTKSVSIHDIYWPTDKRIDFDIHLMFKRPESVLDQLERLSPHLVIIHAEADGDLKKIIERLRQAGIQCGLAVLQETRIADIAHLINHVHHILIFSGALGSFGGRADLSLLGKVSEIKSINPYIEIGWDGGANSENITALVRGGIDIINVGSAIQKAIHPQNAYLQLVRQLDN